MRIDVILGVIYVYKCIYIYIYAYVYMSSSESCLHDKSVNGLLSTAVLVSSPLWFRQFR